MNTLFNFNQNPYIYFLISTTVHKYLLVDRFFPIETISYGVQDLVYTRVFAMIVVRENAECSTSSCSQNSFECHAFVCDSRQSARKLTYSLATAFQEYSKQLRQTRKQFAIDLRTPEEIEREPKYRDSEA